MDVVKLIRAVKSRNPLWDRKHAYYHDRVVTMGLWNDVANSLGTDLIDSSMAKEMDVNEKKKKRRKTVLDVDKLLDLNKNYQREVRKKAYHLMCDMEEIRLLERFDRRRYRRKKSHEMKMKADSARAKWKGLRDTFRGELRKVNKSIANGTPCRSTNWEYFDEMFFVKDQIYSNRRSLADALHMQQRTSVPTTAAGSPIDEGNESVDIADLCSQEVVEGDEEIDPQGGSEDGNSPAHLRMVTDPQPSVPPSPLIHTPHVHPTDDDYNFLMSILPQLRSLPTMRNLFVRLKIQELLYGEIVALQEST